MKRTGEMETLSFASGLSFPRGDRPSPITAIEGSTALSASYEAASKGSYAAPDTCAPVELNCGCQKRGWFGSLPITKFLTTGYVLASCCRKAANCAIRAGDAVMSPGCAGATANSTRTARTVASGIQ